MDLMKVNKSGGTAILHVVGRAWDAVSNHDFIPAFTQSIRMLPDGCMEWTGTNHGEGYGYLWLNKRHILAHRFSYETFVGPLPSWGPPDYLQLDHICRNRKCVRPDHLRIVTRKENILAGVGVSATNIRKNYCRNGHPYNAENTFHKECFSGGKKGVSRICRVCTRARGLAKVHGFTFLETLRKIESGELSMERISMIGRKLNISDEERERRRTSMKANRRRYTE